MRILPSVAVLLAAAGTVSAQEGAGWVVLQGGSVVSMSGDVLKGGPVFGLGVGGWFTNRWGAEVAVLSTQVKVKATEVKGQEAQGLVSVLFNFNPGGTFAPFVRLGLGVVANQGDLKDLEGDQRASAHGGLGVQGRFGNHLFTVVEVRDTRVGRKTPFHNEVAGLLGFGYRWGGGTSGGRGVPAAAGPGLPRRPVVEAVPAGTPVPGAEEVRPKPQAPGGEVLPPPRNPPPPVVLLP